MAEQQNAEAPRRADNGEQLPSLGSDSGRDSAEATVRTGEDMLMMKRQRRVRTQLERVERAILGNVEMDNDVLTAVVQSVTGVLEGESVLSTPATSLAQWLGTITVSPGDIRGPLVKQYRTFIVESHILAAGHVLPWKISATWRYSQLRELLVDNLRAMAQQYSLWDHYDVLISTFPPKVWSGRLSDAVCQGRASSIQQYIAQGIEITTQLVLEGVMDEEGLYAILGLFTYDLLDLKRKFQDQIAELSANLGSIISSAPKDHCLLDNDFNVAPQQGL